MLARSVILAKVILTPNEIYWPFMKFFYVHYQATKAITSLFWHQKQTILSCIGPEANDWFCMYMVLYFYFINASKFDNVLTITHIIKLCNSAISVRGHEHGYHGLWYMIIQQVSQGKTWCLILSLVNVWSSPLCDMSVCPLLTMAIACWLLLVHLVKGFFFFFFKYTQASRHAIKCLHRYIYIYI